MIFKQLCMLCWVLGGSDILLDEIVMVVDKDVVTSSELECDMRLALALRETARTAQGVLSGEVRTQLRDYVLNQRLIAQEVRKAGLSDVPVSDVDESFKKLVSHFASEKEFEEFLKKYGITRSYVRDILGRDMANEKYIRKRVAARLLRVENADADAQEALFREALEGWLKELRANADVKISGASGELERLVP